jgi:hypothetical protein
MDVKRVKTRFLVNDSPQVDGAGGKKETAQKKEFDKGIGSEV